jgi:hypothetical protein
MNEQIKTLIANLEIELKTLVDQKKLTTNLRIAIGALRTAQEHLGYHAALQTSQTAPDAVAPAVEPTQP